MKTCDTWIKVHNHGIEPETWKARTGSGGTRIHFRCHSPRCRAIRTRPFDGIDIRGQGGFVMAPPSPHYVLRVKLHLERWRRAVGMRVRGSVRLALGNRQREDRPRQHRQRRKPFIIGRCPGQHPTMASMLLVSASMAATRQWPTPWLDDPPSPTTTPNRSWRSPPPETSGSARVRPRTPCSAAPSPPAARV